MKKTLLTLLLMVVGLATWAQRWTSPSPNDYSDRYAVYVQVYSNGERTTSGIEIGAFIDGECRSSVSFPDRRTGYYVLQIYGNDGSNGTVNDNGKTINLRIAADGLVYNVKKTLTYAHGETYTDVPMVINLDRITGVKITNPLKIVQKVGTTYDLTKDVAFLYESKLQGVVPVGNTELDTNTTPLTYKWDFSNSSSYFTVNTSNVLSILKPCADKYLGLTVTGPDGSEFNVSTSTSVTIEEPFVDVTSLSLSKKTIEMWTEGNLLDSIAKYITVLPTDATNKNFGVTTKVSGATPLYNENYIAKTPGTQVLKVYSLSNPSIYTEVTLVVKQQVTELSWNGPRVVNIMKGENAYEIIAGYTTVLPENATDKTLFFRPSAISAFASDGTALKTGRYTVDVISASNHDVFFTIGVVVKQPVESIVATPDSIKIKVGESLMNALQDKVSVKVLPTNAENQDYYFEASADAVQHFDNSDAVKALDAGTFEWYVVSSENKDIRDAIKVTVVEPVYFTFPDSVDVFVWEPTNAKFTVSSEYDPTLLDVATKGGTVTFDANSNMTITGERMGCFLVEVYYDGEYAGAFDVAVNGVMKAESGWNWISNYTTASIPLCNATDGSYLTQYFNGDSKILEARSQTELLYNDSRVGVFGDIQNFYSDKMYKVKTNGAMNFVIPYYDADLKDGTEYISFGGYTWICYPVIGNHSFKYFNEKQLLTSAEEGDVIIGKDGFAEYNGTKWVASANFMMESGNGYIYYNSSKTAKTLYFGEHYVHEGSTSNAKARTHSASSVWNVMSSEYADNMPVVAKIDGIETSSRYSIGAFVGEECRGMGEFVDDDVMFINVAGKSGEDVCFKLYDSMTDSYYELPETVRYSSSKKGSLKAPFCLSAASAVTGIDNVSVASSANNMYNLQGQKVNDAAKGIVILNGKKIVRK